MSVDLHDRAEMIGPLERPVHPTRARIVEARSATKRGRRIMDRLAKRLADAHITWADLDFEFEGRYFYDKDPLDLEGAELLESQVMHRCLP